jgi:hypothetical protein
MVIGGRTASDPISKTWTERKSCWTNTKISFPSCGALFENQLVRASCQVTSETALIFNIVLFRHIFFFKYETTDTTNKVEKKISKMLHKHTHDWQGNYLLIEYLWFTSKAIKTSKKLTSQQANISIHWTNHPVTRL